MIESRDFIFYKNIFSTISKIISNFQSSQQIMEIWQNEHEDLSQERDNKISLKRNVIKESPKYRRLDLDLILYYTWLKRLETLMWNKFMFHEK